MPAPRPRISLVMPAYNEEENLAEAVAQARAPLAAISPDWEIVLVNDGSADRTGAIADELAAADPRVRAVHHAHNKGLGGALVSGFGAARGEVFGYCDADLPFDLWDLKAAYDLMERERADVVAGFRFERSEGARRHLYTAAYNGLVRAVFGFRVRDVNCPLKLFRREVFEAEGLHSTGSFIDAELLARAHRNGFRIVEFGARYTPRTRGISTLSRPSVIVGILGELVRYRLGRLGPPPQRPAPCRPVPEDVSQDTTPPPSLPPHLLAGLVLLHVWRWAYAYGGGDHDEVLPQVLHRLDPTLFTRDWFVMSQAGALTIRTTFVEAMRLLALGMPLSVAVASVHVGVLLAVGWGTYKLGLALVPERLGAALGALLAVVLVPHWTLGGNRLTYGLLAPENLAWALALPAVWLFVEKRRLPSAVLLGLAAWVQLLVGALTAAVLGAVALWEAAQARSTREAGRALSFGAVAAAVAAPLAVPILLAPPLPGDGLPGVSAFHALARLRVPHHYLPSAFAPGDYVRFGLLAGAGTAALGMLQRRGRLRHGPFVVRFLVVVSMLCGIAVVCTEVVPVLFVAQLQLFKLTVWATTLFALLVGAGVAGSLPARVRALGERVLGRPVGGLLAVALATALTGSTLAMGFGPAQARYTPAAHAASDLGRAEAWARTHTPENALFLVPPSNTTFRMGARRSVVVNFKPTPYQRGGIGVWLGRMLAVAPMPVPESGHGFQEALDAAYAANDAAGWQRLAHRFGAGWALVDATRTASPPPGPPAFRAGGWAIYRLQSD